MVIDVMSFGGGLNSSAMLAMLVDAGTPPDLVLFSDTGDEMPATYEFVEFYRLWCKASGIRFETLKSHLADSLYDFSIKGRSIPSRLRRECSFKFKVRPIRKFLRQEYGDEENCYCDKKKHGKGYRPHRFHMMIGITTDEAHRAKDSDVWYIKNSYPLLDARIDRPGCTDILGKYALPIPPKSGCFYCPFQRKSSWVNLQRNHIDLFDKAVIMEENGQRYPELTLYSKPLRGSFGGQTYFDQETPDDDRCDSGYCWT